MGGLSDCGCHAMVSLATGDPIRDGSVPMTGPCCQAPVPSLPKVSPSPNGLDLPHSRVVGWESMGGSQKREREKGLSARS